VRVRVRIRVRVRLRVQVELLEAPVDVPLVGLDADRRHGGPPLLETHLAVAVDIPLRAEVG